MPHPLTAHPLAHFFTPRDARSRRASSWDRSGANIDYIVVEPGTTVSLLEADGPGCITHLYCGMVLPEITDYRDAILRCYWNGEDAPAVCVPLGDFFGIAHGRVREYTSALTSVNDGLGASHGLNSYLPMPFSQGAIVTLENRSEKHLGGLLGALWFHIDYELYDEPLPEGTEWFHAGYRQEAMTDPVGAERNEPLHGAQNTDGAENFVALDTSGHGRMVGLLLEIDNVQGARWYGEGDDMVFIDGEGWPPAIHGTGTEEIFGGGACPNREYSGPYTGFHLVESSGYEGLVGMYRWFHQDPIHFGSSLRWTIEHGHANNFANHYASVAYWYQEPVAAQAVPPPSEIRPPTGDGYEEARELLFDTAAAALRLRETNHDHLVLHRACEAGREFYYGNWAAAVEELAAFRSKFGI